VPSLTPQQLTIGLAVAGSFTLIACLLCLRLQMRLGAMRHEYAVLRGDQAPQDLFTIVGRCLERLGAMEHRVDEVVASHEEIYAIVRYALSKFAVVRFDAFPDMGGQMSFSAAFVDENGDGLVITSINGRSETRTYAKAVRALSSVHNLSQEELQAIDAAVAGEGRGDAQPASSSTR
jgi:hypothetical protein